mgnify:CR=1 FL=1
MKDFKFTMVDGLSCKDYPEETFPKVIEEAYQVFECTWVKELDNAENDKIEVHKENLPMSEKNLSYVPLHVRSCYSINDGLQNVGDIVKRAAKLKIPAIAVTDFNNMAGFVRFYSACMNSGIKPIIGADI